MNRWIDLLAAFSEIREPYALGHGRRVAVYAEKIAKKMGVSSEPLAKIAILHDIGKIIVPEMILDKPTGLEKEEWNVIREHPVFSEKFISLIPEIAQYAIWARWHHERMDGKGYPDGIPAGELPLEVRILSVSNAFSVLTEKRSYKDAVEEKAAKKQLLSEAGTKWDVDVVKTLVKYIHITRASDDFYKKTFKIEKRLLTPFLKLQAIYRIAEEIKNMVNVDYFIKRVLVIIHDVLKIKGKYFLLVPRGKSLKVVAQVGATDSIIGLVLPPDKGLSNYSYSTKEPVIVNNVLVDDRFYQTPGENVKAEISIPIIFKNEVIGIIDIESIEESAFTKYDKQFIQAVAATIAPALKTAEIMSKLQDIAFYDQLTGAYSFPYFEEHFKQIISLSERENLPVSLCFIDLDYLKIINDTFGHLEGDKILKSLVMVIKDNIRGSDMIARYGGDEFILLITNADKNKAEEILKRIDKEFEIIVTNILNKSDIKYGFSFGIAEYGKDGTTLKQLIKRSDEIMYKFKAAKKIRG